MSQAQAYAEYTFNYTPPEEVRPVIQGDWVCSLYDGKNVRLGRVRQSWNSDGKTFMDLVLYEANGNKVGRVSPRCGGPKTFEPAIEWDPECWTRIYTPNFPCEPTFAFRDKPGEPGVKTGGFSIFRDEHNKNGVSIKPIRTKPVKEPTKAVSFRLPVKPTNGPEVEAAALRRSAQEIRDMARGSPDAERLNKRAAELEAEAARLA